MRTVLDMIAKSLVFLGILLLLFALVDWLLMSFVVRTTLIVVSGGVLWLLDTSQKYLIRKKRLRSSGKAFFDVAIIVTVAFAVCFITPSILWVAHTLWSKWSDISMTLLGYEVILQASARLAGLYGIGGFVSVASIEIGKVRDLIPIVVPTFVIALSSFLIVTLLASWQSYYTHASFMIAIGTSIVTFGVFGVYLVLGTHESQEIHKVKQSYIT